MQDYVEREGAIGEMPMASESLGGVTGPAAGQSIERWALGLAGTIIVGLGGWIYKNRRSGQTLEDTTNETTVVTIRNQQERIRELEGSVKQMLQEIQSANTTMLESQRSANNATIQADNAQAAATRATAAAEEARREANHLSVIVERQTRYILLLKAALHEAGLPLPEEPK